MSAIPAKKIECNRYNPVGRNQLCPERNQEYMLGKRWREHGDRDAADQPVTSVSLSNGKNGARGASLGKRRFVRPITILSVCKAGIWRMSVEERCWQSSLKINRQET
jgi:hypothetical protein